MVSGTLAEMFAVTPGIAGMPGANERVFGELLEEHLRFKGNLVPCLGAGMSTPTYPLWGSSLRLMASLIPHVSQATKSRIDDLVARGECDQAASELFEAAGQSAFDDTIRETFSPARATTEAVEGTAVGLLPEVFSEGPVLTLNFDCLLERAVYRGPNSFGDHIIRGPVQFTQDRRDLIRGARRVLLKMHGCATRPREVVFTKRQYDQYYHPKNDSLNASFLSLLFQAHPVLFLGCSLVNDRTMALLSRIARRNDLPHFALLPMPQDPAQFALDGKRLSDAGIRPIWYPTGQHEFVRRVLESMRAAVPDVAPRTSARLEGAAANHTPSPECIGREALIQDVWRKLTSSASRQAVEVQGGPGIGKSTLSREVLARARIRGWRTIDVPLSQITTMAGAMGAILTAAGSRSNPATPDPIERAGLRTADSDFMRQNQLEELMSSEASPTILYLDNMEDPQADPNFVRWLADMPGQTNWRILYSTQITVRHPAVAHFHVGPLKVGDAEALFQHRWRREIGPDDRSALLDLVRETDCHPLSLVLIAGQRDRWLTVGEVLRAWREEANDFRMEEAEPRHKSLDIAYRLATDRVRKDPACMEVLAALAHVPDFLSVPALNLVLDIYPSLRAEHADPVGVLLHNGLVETSTREFGGHIRTVYSMLNPLKMQTLATADEETIGRAINRLARAYAQVLDATRSHTNGRLEGPEGEVVISTAHQAWNLLASALDPEKPAGQRLLWSLRDHVRYLPRGAQAVVNQITSQGITVDGCAQLAGSVSAKPSGRASIPLILAAAVNRGTSRLRRLERTPEADVFVAALGSIGVVCEWSVDDSELIVTRSEELTLSGLNGVSARQTWACVLLPVLFVTHRTDGVFPVGGSDPDVANRIRALARVLRLGAGALLRFSDGDIHARFGATWAPKVSPTTANHVTLIDVDEAVAIGAILTVAQLPHATVLHFVPQSHSVSEVCAYLSACGVRVEGVGSPTITVHGVDRIDATVMYSCTEDPFDALVLVTAAIITRSRLSVQRVPIDYVTIELAVLEEFGVRINRSAEYVAENGSTRLVDIDIMMTTSLTPVFDKIHPDPQGGLDVSSLPLFLIIAAHADGRSMLHDWMSSNGWMEEGRIRFLMNLMTLGASVDLLDPYRVVVSGPASWRGQEVDCPRGEVAALCTLVASLGVPGRVEIRRVGAQRIALTDLGLRLRTLGARISGIGD